MRVNDVLEQISEFDAGEFEDLLKGLQKMASDTSTAYPPDVNREWGLVALCLEWAVIEVQKRGGN